CRSPPPVVSLRQSVAVWRWWIRATPRQRNRKTPSRCGLRVIHAVVRCLVDCASAGTELAPVLAFGPNPEQMARDTEGGVHCRRAVPAPGDAGRGDSPAPGQGPGAGRAVPPGRAVRPGERGLCLRLGRAETKAPLTGSNRAPWG